MRKKVIHLSGEGEILNTFPCTRDAAEHFNYGKGWVCKRCQGALKTVMNDGTDLCYCSMESIKAALKRLNLNPKMAYQIQVQAGIRPEETIPKKQVLRILLDHYNVNTMSAAYDAATGLDELSKQAWICADLIDDILYSLGFELDKDYVTETETMIMNGVEFDRFKRKAVT